MDALHVALGKGLVLAAFHAGANGCLAHGNGPGAQGPACITSATALGQVFNDTHHHAPKCEVQCANFEGFCKGFKFCPIGEQNSPCDIDIWLTVWKSGMLSKR
jgi:hypothetical protein